jgi:pyridoxamine 5'-phosphate oxidase
MIDIKQISNEAPFDEFEKEFKLSLSLKQPLPQAACISSFNSKLQEVNSRFVNIKYVHERDFIFFSNYQSQKARDFKESNKVSLVFFWSTTDTQIRIKGIISKTDKNLSDEHFKSRNREKNLLSICSDQSSVIESFERFLEKYNNSKHIDTSIRPNYWGGYSIRASYFEFWKGSELRLNKRKVFKLDEDGKWIKSYLQP